MVICNQDTGARLWKFEKTEAELDFLKNKKIKKKGQSITGLFLSQIKLTVRQTFMT